MTDDSLTVERHGAVAVVTVTRPSSPRRNPASHRDRAATDDWREGARAFLEKRAPRFTGS